MPVVEAKNLHSFLMGMLKLNPEERHTAQKILTHPWLQGLPCPEVSEFVNRNSLATMNPVLGNSLPPYGEGRSGREGGEVAMGARAAPVQPAHTSELQPLVQAQVQLSETVNTAAA